MKSTALDDLPDVTSFLGIIDLKTGSLIIAAMGIVHPMAYGCSLFMPISYLIVTIWILVTLFFAASIVLLFGITKEDHVLCAIWIWYALIFVVVMLMLMILLVLVFTSRKQRSRVFIVIFGILWYIATVYFILIVNSYRKQLVKDHGMSGKLLEKSKVEDVMMEETTPPSFLRIASNGENIPCVNVAEDTLTGNGGNVSCIQISEDLSH